MEAAVKEKSASEMEGKNGSQRLPAIRFRIRGLQQGESPIQQTFEASALDFPAFSGSGSITGTVRRTGDRIDLETTVSAEGSFECTRCADPFHRIISTPLALHLVPERLGQPAGDPDVHTYDPIASADIDLTQDVRDALILAIPMKNLCRAGCKGLCPICGKNWNIEPCACKEPNEEIGGIAALKGLRERLRAEENPVRSN